MKSTLVLTALVLLVAAPLAASSIPEPPAPQPGSAKLAMFVGSWSGDGEMTESGKPPVKVRITLDCQNAAGGWAVRCSGSFVSPGMNYLETDLFGYDAATGKVHLYTVTNAGEVHDHAGNWNGDSSLMVRHPAGSSGEPDEDLTIRFDAKNVMAFEDVTTVAGSTAATLRGRVTKKR